MDLSAESFKPEKYWEWALTRFIKCDKVDIVGTMSMKRTKNHSDIDKALVNLNKSAIFLVKVIMWVKLATQWSNNAGMIRKWIDNIYKNWWNIPRNFSWFIIELCTLSS